MAKYHAPRLLQALMVLAVVVCAIFASADAVEEGGAASGRSLQAKCTDIKNQAACWAASDLECRWIFLKWCPKPNSPPKKCKTFSYGCRAAYEPFCGIKKGTVAQKKKLCNEQFGCTWQAKGKKCVVNEAEKLTRKPSAAPITSSPTVPTNSPTTSSPTVPTAAPTTLQPTSRGDASCYEGCWTSQNGVCEDGMPGSKFSWCYPGSDCIDCGPRPELMLHYG